VAETSDRKVLIIALAVMFGLVGFGVGFGALFAATQCRALDPIAMTQDAVLGTADDVDATLLALLPVLTSTGTGADVLIPMAIPAVGGMAVELLTLFVVPILFGAVEEMRLRLRGGDANPPGGAQAPGVAVPPDESSSEGSAVPPDESSSEGGAVPPDDSSSEGGMVPPQPPRSDGGAAARGTLSTGETT
jgi:hypothetical protein